MVISWFEMTNPMVQNDWYEMVMVRNIHNSFCRGERRKYAGKKVRPHNTRIDFSTSEASRALAQGYKNRQKVILNNTKDIAVFYII